MTLPTLMIDTQGNVDQADAQRISWDAMTNARIPAATQPYIVAGTGAPTFTAPKATIYMRLDGSSTATRIYVNTDGATTWTNVTTAA